MNETAEPSALIIFGIWGIPGLFLVAWMVARVRQTGGLVRTQMLGLPDLLMSFFLCGFFSLAVLAAGMKGAAPPSPEAANAAAAGARAIGTEQILPNVLFFLALVGIILGMLWFRRIRIGEFFGLKAVSPPQAIVRGVLIIAAIFPMLSLMGLAMQGLLQESAHEQEVVTLFREVAKAGQQQYLTMLFLLAVVFQPIVEEIIFRGYIYATFKGWAGTLASAVATSMLFATVHTNIVALPPLFFLALVLTLAYEWTGSILVPIAMHMAFNGSQLLFLKWMMERQAS